MGRKSSVSQLDPRLREMLDNLLREDRHTLDDVLAKLAELNDGVPPVSRSALGRYAQNANATMSRYKEASEIATIWGDNVANKPNSDVTRLLLQMLSTMAFQTMGDMGEREDAADPKELMVLAKALKDISSADKLNYERIKAIKADAVEKAAAEAVKGAKAAGLSDEAANVIRQKILGVV